MVAIFYRIFVVCWSCSQLYCFRDSNCLIYKEYSKEFVVMFQVRRHVVWGSVNIRKLILFLNESLVRKTSLGNFIIYWLYSVSLVWDRSLSIRAKWRQHLIWPNLAEAWRLWIGGWPPPHLAIWHRASILFCFYSCYCFYIRFRRSLQPPIHTRKHLRPRVLTL